jgi:AraC-like DNA-binding protein
MAANELMLKYELDLAPSSTWVTITASLQAKRTLLYVQELGMFYSGPEYYTERQGLNSFLIKYTLAGKGEISYGDQQIKLTKGQLFWLDCRQYQYYRTSPDAGSWDILWVHFYGESAQQYYELFMSQNGGSIVLDMPPDNEVEKKLNNLISMYSSASNDFVTDVEASGVLSSLLLEIIKALATGTASSSAPASVMNAREYIAEHYKEDISLNDLSSRLHVNKFHLLRSFKRYVGTTPNEFLIQTRLNKAKGFLRTTNQSVTQIAAMVGIHNTSHFINLFKKHEQTTPGIYRRQWYGKR